MGEKMHFSELDQYLFGQGTHYDIYKKLGAHPTTCLLYTSQRQYLIPADRLRYRLWDKDKNISSAG